MCDEQAGLPAARYKALSRWLLDVIAAGMTIAAIGLLSVVGQYLAFRAGLRNDTYPILFMGGAAALFFVGIIVMIVHMIVAWKRSSNAIRLLRIGLLLAWLPTSSVCGLFVMREDPYLSGLRDRLRIQKVDFEEVRSWGKSHRDFFGDTAVGGIDAASIHVSEDGLTIYFCWGGAFFPRRTLVVGPQEAIIPEETLEVAPGVYLFQSGG